MTNQSTEASILGELAPNLALLRELRRTGSVTRAAESVAVPQPTASRRLAALGERLGAALVVPSGRGVRLTRVGAVLAEAAEQGMGAIEAGVRQALEENSPERGYVALAFLHLLGRSMVPELLRDFRADHPHVRFGLSQGSRHDVLDDLVTGGVDIAFVAPLPTADPRFTTVLLTHQEIHLAVPAAHRLADRRVVRLEELAEEEFAMLEEGYGLRQITDDACAAAGFRPNIAFEGQESDTVRGLVGAGLGVALLPAATPGPTPGVVELTLRPRLSRSIGAVWHADRQLAPAAAAFGHFIEQRGRRRP